MTKTHTKTAKTLTKIKVKIKKIDNRKVEKNK